MQEQQQKESIKQKARAWLEDWKTNLQHQNAQRLNQLESSRLGEGEREALYAKNPWQKVIDNVEVDTGKYVGEKDVSRMRQAMISRKNDLMKEGANIMQF